MHEPPSAASAPETPPSAEPVQQGSSTSDDLASDPRVLQILSAEHFDLLSARGLAYNEAFTRAVGGTGLLALVVAIGATLIVLATLGRWAFVEMTANQAALPVLFPAPPAEHESSQPAE